MKGGVLEQLIARSAARQREQGLWLLQTSPRFIPAGVIGPRGETSGRVIGAGGLDFHGDWNGRAVMLDAKSTESRTRFDLRLIKPHQAVLVKNAHARGALAGFLVELGARSPAAEYYLLTWPLLAPWWAAYQQAEAGLTTTVAASIPAHVLSSAVRVRRERGQLDLAGALAQLMKQRPRAAAE